MNKKCIRGNFVYRKLQRKRTNKEYAKFQEYYRKLTVGHRLFEVLRDNMIFASEQ